MRLLNYIFAFSINLAHHKNTQIGVQKAFERLWDDADYFRQILRRDVPQILMSAYSFLYRISSPDDTQKRYDRMDRTYDFTFNDEQNS